MAIEKHNVIPIVAISAGLRHHPQVSELRTAEDWIYKSGRALQTHLGDSVTMASGLPQTGASNK